MSSSSLVSGIGEREDRNIDIPIYTAPLEHAFDNRRVKQHNHANVWECLEMVVLIVQKTCTSF